MSRQICYDDDPAYPIQEYDEVTIIVAGEFRIPALVKKVLPKRNQVVVSFEGVDPVLDLIILRKSARIPATAIELVERGA